MDKNGMIRVSVCCNATVEPIDLKTLEGSVREYICNTCDKVCKVILRKSSNAE